MMMTILTDGSVSLCDDEDVINADAEQEEGDDGVGGRVEETEHGAEPVAQHHPHHHAEDAHHREPEPLLHQVEP